MFCTTALLKQEYDLRCDGIQFMIHTSLTSAAFLAVTIEIGIEANTIDTNKALEALEGLNDIKKMLLIKTEDAITLEMQKIKMLHNILKKVKIPSFASSLEMVRENMLKEKLILRVVKWENVICDRDMPYVVTC